MKRSAKIAALDNSIDIMFGKHESDYEESVMVASMMLVTIDEESRRVDQRLRKQRSDGSIGSMSAASTFSRSSSRGSLRGWGSTASRKSYKIDLCSLAANDFHGETISSHHTASSDRRYRPSSPTLKKNEVCNNNNSNDNNCSSVINNAAADSWGFFLG
mmetsp:Transcript_15829/g.36648  ORF Transcript_15829/g.36648 Transcript_15829/m.36648 type:complete len:159 (+) Transcript_15829:191-667(+)|eukprot:CAMPEP_0197181594 /NCGR_PEP_ID=MMETSP1423-20130617/5838_1 /TAXON_ID=476441 /ORGANISM="Pseudo-nitzschia heimii, Strain UNC1101" /LENGTH=158 /DNA_ID=CAMNT_0042631881 /DNA_START=108 /DNA_END=584 /DNA_ORIENTATION=-